MRLQQRHLRAEMLVAAAPSFEIIESYVDDKYLPSFLVRCEAEGVVFHAQIATDVTNVNVRIVTMYVPEAQKWHATFRSRKEP